MIKKIVMVIPFVLCFSIIGIAATPYYNLQERSVEKGIAENYNKESGNKSADDKKEQGVERKANTRVKPGLPAYCIPEDVGFWDNPAGRGWFWYQEECQPVEEEEEQQEVVKAEPEKPKWKLLPEKADIPWDIIDKIDPDEVAQKIEPEARKVMVMYPTNENIAEYRKLNMWMLTKAMMTANNDVRFRTENPNFAQNDYTGSKDINISQFSLIATRERDNELKNNHLLDYRTNAGLVVYVSPSCKFCERQRPILEMFQQQYGWEIVYRNMSDPRVSAEASRFNVVTIPDIFLVYRPTNNPEDVRYQRIATGLTTLDVLETQALRGLYWLGEKISPQLVLH